MKRIVTATITAALLAIAATTAQAGWEDAAKVFGGLFGSNSTAVVASYMEDGSFYIEDEFGNVYKGCQLGMPCDDTVLVTSNVYLPTVSK